MRLPEQDKHSVTREKLKADLAVAMGGRVAEELIFGYDKVTSGASSDIQYATKMARAMVTQWGMSDKLGPLDYGEESQDMYYSVGRSQSFSEETAKLIDAEVKVLVDEAHQRAETVLKDHDKQLHALAEALLKYETLSGDEIQTIIDGGEIVRVDESETKKSTRRASVPTSGGEKGGKSDTKDTSESKQFDDVKKGSDDMPKDE